MKKRNEPTSSLPLSVQVLLFADDIITTSSQTTSRKNSKNISFLQVEVSQECKKDPDASTVPSAVYFDMNSDDNLDSSSSSSSSASSSEWTMDHNNKNTSTISGTNDSMKRCLPIDVQFTLPAYAIVLLYCLGHCAFSELCTLAIDNLACCCSSVLNVQIGMLALGFLLQRITGDIWYWSSLVDSDAFYDKYRETKRYRLMLARGLCMGGSKSPLTKSERAKRGILKKDIQIIKWFKRHEGCTMLISLLGFYLTYIPVDYFHKESCLWLAAIPRHEILSELPSTKLTAGGINFSPVFRSIVSASGPSPLLSKEEVAFWDETVAVPQEIPDMALRREPIGPTNFCSGINGTLESFLQMEDELYSEDEEYLKEHLSEFSYSTFFGDAPAYFISAKGIVAVNMFIFGCSVSLLLKGNFPFFDV